MADRDDGNVPVDAGRGTLVLVVGPSGVGKDTLLNGARLHFADDTRFLFPQRVITRADMTGEEHLAVSRPQFQAMADEGAFLISWDAHGHGYGIPMAIKLDLAQGRTVIINTSRGKIQDARRAWPQIGVVNVIAGPQVLRARLQARGREGAVEIEERLTRSSRFPLPPDVRCDELDNSGDLAGGISRFASILEGYARKG